MNVSNSNKLGFPLPAATASGNRPSSAKADKSSPGNVFGDLLSKGKTKDQDAEPKMSGSNLSDSKQRLEKRLENQQPEKQVAEKLPSDKQPVQTQPTEMQSNEKQPTAEAKALPTTPGLPGLQGPGISERVLNTPVASPMGPMSEKIPQVPVEEQGVDSLTRRVVWNDFLRKMKDELGVMPEDVLHAFTQLSNEDLALPPQQTLDKVVMALGLTGQEAQVAKSHFQELVTKTQSPTMGEELTASQKQLHLTLMSQRELQRKALQKSLKGMDENFFMNSAAHLQAQSELRTLMQQQPKMNADPNTQNKDQGGFFPKTMPPMTALEAGSMESADLGARLMAPGAATAMPVASESMNALDQQSLEQQSLGVEAPMAASQSSSASKPATNLENMKAADFNQVLAEMEAPVKEDQKAMDALLKQFNGGKLNAAAAKGLEANAAAVQATPAAASAATSAAPNSMASAIGGLFAGAKITDQRESGGGATDSGSEGTNFTPGLTGGEQLREAKGLGGEFKAELAQQAGPPIQAAIPEVVQNAELLMKDGGGEMKIVMNPEGLGEVAMKVNVENGNVSVQMITESDEAKKLLEREMGALKAGLAQQNLRVETIKVDTASSMGTQLDQQYQDSQRQQAQQAMEHFRQNQQGWRKSFFEVASARNYRGQTEAPRDVKAPSRAQAKGSKRLDLVA